MYVKVCCSLSLLATLFALSFLPTLASAHPAQAAATDWWNPQWRYRIPITIGSNGSLRTDKPAELSLNFTQLLAGLGVSGSFDANSIRVIEVDSSNNVLSDTVPFQFDQSSGYNATTNATGTLVLMMSGTTAATGTRSYHLYFDLAGKGFTTPNFTPKLTLTDYIFDEDQNSYRIETEQGDYYYQKLGASISSLVDQAGNDWINYKPTGGAGGSYRGVPNMIHPEGKFHPGNTDSTSTILTQGPLKITIKSTTNDGKWEALWEFFPEYVRMTLLKHGHDYWFLYEGTPGGTLDRATDFVVRSDGTQTLAAVSWDANLVGPKWAYFADPMVNRSFFVASHQEGAQIDSYYPMTEAAGSMTVFGFGRRGLEKFLTATPSRFTIGLMDTTQFNQGGQIINNAYQELSIQVGSAANQPMPIPSPTPTATATKTATPVPTATKTKVPSATPTATTPAATPTAVATTVPTLAATATATTPPATATTATGVPTTITTATATTVPATTEVPTTIATATTIPATTEVPTIVPSATPTAIPATPTVAATVAPSLTPIASSTPAPETVITTLTATQTAAGVAIHWQTSVEINSAGFYLYRIAARDGVPVQITSLLPSQGAQGGSYQFIDQDVEFDQTYNYLLVEETLSGDLIKYEDQLIVIGIGNVDNHYLFLPLVNN